MPAAARIPATRVAALARFAVAAKASAVLRLPNPRRLATLVASVHCLEATAQDDALELHSLDPQAGRFVFDGAINGVTGRGMFAFSLDDGVNNGHHHLQGTRQRHSGGLQRQLGQHGGGSERDGPAALQGRRRVERQRCVCSASANGRTPVAVADAHAIAPKMLCIGSARNHQFV